MKKEERQRPALGDERRADFGVSRDKAYTSRFSRERLKTTLIYGGAIVAAVVCVVVTARILESGPEPRRAVLAPATQNTETATAAPAITPVPTQPPTQAPTPTPLEPDPTVVTEGILTFVAPDGSLRLLTQDGDEQVIAQDVLHPAIHPDRDAVAFVRYDGQTSEIWIWEADGGAELLGSRDGLVQNLEWDGDALLYHVQDDGDTTTVIRRYDFFWGAAETVLASDEFSFDGASIQGFDVFPDGSLAVQVNVPYDDTPCAIYIVDTFSASAESITAPGDGACYSQPSVSPDGEEVAFIAQSAEGGAQIAVVDADGGDYRELAAITTPDSAEGVFWPRIAWSPDSEVVLYETLDDGESVYAQDANDTAGKTRRLVAHGHHPAWQ